MINKLMLSVVLFCLSCKIKDETDTSSLFSNEVTSSSSSGQKEQPTEYCVEGDKRSCHVNLESHGTTNCFVGVQYCVEGRLSACAEK